MWRLLVLAVLVITTSTQPVFLVGSAFTRIGPELGFGPVGLGLLTAGFFLTASFTSAPLGRWVQRVGWQRAMRVNTLLGAVVLSATGVLARSAWALGALMVAAAAVYGMSNPAANQALADHADPRHRALVFGIKHAGIPTSTLLAGLAVPALVLTVGWRWAFEAAALLALVVHFSVPRGRVEAATLAVAADARRSVRPLGVRRLLGLALGSAMASWAAVGLGTYLVAAAVHTGFSEAAAGWLEFVGSSLSIVARVVAGAVTDRRGGRGFFGVALLAGTGAVVFALLPAAAGVGFVVGVLLAFVTGWAWPGLMTFTVVNANRASAASSSAVTQAGVFLGAGAGPLVIGAVIERWSFGAGWLAVAAALAVAATVVAWVGRLAAIEARSPGE